MRIETFSVPWLDLSHCLLAKGVSYIFMIYSKTKQCKHFNLQNNCYLFKTKNEIAFSVLMVSIFEMCIGFLSIFNEHYNSKYYDFLNNSIRHPDSLN